MTYPAISQLKTLFSADKFDAGLLDTADERVADDVGITWQICQQNTKLSHFLQVGYGLRSPALWRQELAELAAKKYPEKADHWLAVYDQYIHPFIIAGHQAYVDEDEALWEDYRILLFNALNEEAFGYLEQGTESSVAVTFPAIDKLASWTGEVPAQVKAFFTDLPATEWQCQFEFIPYPAYTDKLATVIERNKDTDSLDLATGGYIWSIWLRALAFSRVRVLSQLSQSSFDLSCVKVKANMEDATELFFNIDPHSANSEDELDKLILWRVAAQFQSIVKAAPNFVLVKFPAEGVLQFLQDTANRSAFVVTNLSERI